MYQLRNLLMERSFREIFPNYVSSSEFFCRNTCPSWRIPREKGRSNLGHIPALPMMEFPLGNNIMLLFVKQMRIFVFS